MSGEGKFVRQKVSEGLIGVGMGREMKSKVEEFLVEEKLFQNDLR